MSTKELHQMDVAELAAQLRGRQVSAVEVAQQRAGLGVHALTIFQRKEPRAQRAVEAAHRAAPYPYTIVRPSLTYGDDQIPLVLNAWQQPWTAIDRMRSISSSRAVRNRIGTSEDLRISRQTSMPLPSG